MSDFFILLVFAFLFVTSNGLPPSTPPKSVNLAVETSFLIEPEDIQNASMLRNVRRFIDKLENLLKPAGSDGSNIFRTDDVVDNVGNENGNKESIDVKNKRKKKIGSRLTKFLTELGAMVINYDDDDEVRGLVKALNDEIARSYVANSKFHEMFYDVAMKLFIKNTVKEWMTTDPLKLKVEIAKYIISDEGSAFVTFFKNDKAKLKKLVKKFRNARKTKQFEKPLGEIFDMIFERFEKLDDESKRRFRDELDKLTKHVVKNFSKRVMIHEDNSGKLSNTTSGDLYERVKEDFKNNDNSIENNANEVRLDKNVQFSVHSDNLI